MRNFVQPGNVLTAIAPSGGVKSGEIVVYNAIVGVATKDADQGEAYELAIGGVYDFPKASSQAWNFGAQIYVDSDGICTTTATSNTLVGVAAAAAASADGVGRVRLNTSF